MYRCHPEKQISDVFVLCGELSSGRADWRKGRCYLGEIRRLCKLDKPILLADLRNHRVLQQSHFIRRNMQGNHLVTEYWYHLHEMIVTTNPKLKKALAKYRPERL